MPMYWTTVHHCAQLDLAAAAATPDSSIAVHGCSNSLVSEVSNQEAEAARVVGPDNIQPELLKYAEEPVSSA